MTDPNSYSNDIMKRDDNNIDLNYAFAISYYRTLRPEMIICTYESVKSSFRVSRFLILVQLEIFILSSDRRLQLAPLSR